ncbi:MAG: formate/nitrite transporter family protein [Candidatus Eremiobacteraeota bacterium]|nr:formate/nitrite transporter family protein [Candidatus Eremiobacteraeota bacterium]
MVSVQPEESIETGEPENAGDRERAGKTVRLSPSEEREVRKRAGLRAEVVFETIRREGEAELKRSAVGLALSGLAAGLSMGFSLVTMGVLHVALPDAPWRPLVESFAYTIGFVIVVLARQQLFTENTVTAILPLLDDPNKPAIFLKVVRMWGIVLGTNLAGAAIFASVAAHTPIFDPPLKAAFAHFGFQVLSLPFWTVLLRGVLAGWLIALMVWLLPAANTQKLWVVIAVTYAVGVLGLTHIVAGSVDALFAVSSGLADVGTYLSHFLLPVFLGNALGGVLLVSLLNYGEIAMEEAA